MNIWLMAIAVANGEGNQNRMVQVTREMASDAGDLSLEGEWIKW